MLEFDLKINHPVGLYAPLAEKMVTIANRNDASIYLSYQNKQVNMKSLMGVISLGVPCGGIVHFCVKGKNEEEIKKAIEGIESLFLLVYNHFRK